MGDNDPGKAVGFDRGTLDVAWTTRDLLLYAIGIGARKDELNLVYELDENFTAFPTYPVVLLLKGDSVEVNDFGKLVKESKKIPGLPPIPPNSLVQVSQYVEIIRPIPKASGKGWKLKGRIVGVHENKSGVIVEDEIVLCDANDVPYTRMVSATFRLGQKITGQKFSKSIAKSIQPSKEVPKGIAPHYTFSHTTSGEQAITYRLSGDYNSLHIDPSIGKKAGFGGVILHGLCSFGITARGLVNTVGGGDPASLKAISCRFTSPVKPGDTLQVNIWELGPGPDGSTEYAFETINQTTGRVSLGGGAAYIKQLTKSRL